MPPITREDVEALFGRRVVYVGGCLKDLVRAVPSNVQIADDDTLEESMSKLQSNIGITGPIIADIEEELRNESALRKQILAYGESLADEQSVTVFRRWWDQILTSQELDTSLRTLRRQKREHNAILQANQAALATAQREMDIRHPRLPPPAPVQPPVRTRTETKLAAVRVPEFSGDKLKFHDWWNQFEALVDKSD